MKTVTVLLIVLAFAFLFFFRKSMYTEGCTSENPEFKDGKRCYKSDGTISLGGPFCKEECTGTWK